MTGQYFFQARTTFIIQIQNLKDKTLWHDMLMKETHVKLKTHSENKGYHGVRGSSTTHPKCTVPTCALCIGYNCYNHPETSRAQPAFSPSRTVPHIGRPSI